MPFFDRSSLYSHAVQQGFDEKPTPDDYPVLKQFIFGFISTFSVVIWLICGFWFCAWVCCYNDDEFEEQRVVLDEPRSILRRRPHENGDMVQWLDESRQQSQRHRQLSVTISRTSQTREYSVGGPVVKYLNDDTPDRDFVALTELEPPPRRSHQQWGNKQPRERYV